MKRDLAALRDREFDVCVVGGGIFGCSAVWEAAHRGLSVALLEQGDFSQATSANHLKMVHGGIRYLQHFDIFRVWESSHERSAMLRIAPHLVSPLPIVMPTYGHGMKGKEILRAGMLFYDLLTWRRNRNIPDPTRHIPRGTTLSRDEALREFPGLKQEGLTGSAVFADAQMYSPPRIAVAFLHSAAARGAAIANHVEATGFIQTGGRVCGVRAVDHVTGAALDVRARVVLNTAGPWAGSLLDKGAGTSLSFTPTFSRDTAMVVRKKLSANYAIAATCKTKDADALFDRGGRHLFMAPWRDWTIVGVWHGVFHGSPENFTVSEEEIASYIEEVNEVYPGFGLTREDVTMINAGLILFGSEEEQEAGKHSFGKRSIIVDHAREEGPEGLITLIGVRATTARGKAQRAIDTAFGKLGRSPTPSRSTEIPLFGGDFLDFERLVEEAERDSAGLVSRELVRPLVHNHGTAYRSLLGLVEECPALGEPLGASTVLKAEVIHAIREELALTLTDVVFRRTDLGTAGHPGEEALTACVDLAAAELGWDRRRAQQELDEVETFLKTHGAVKRFTCSKVGV